MPRKYYWLKLHTDFFDRDEIKIIDKMPNGKDYLIFFLKLLIKSIDHGGRLITSGLIPHNPETLASITDTNIDVVKNAIRVFHEYRLVTILDDGTLYVEMTRELIGSETYWAQKKRSQRNDQQLDILEKNQKHGFPAQLIDKKSNLGVIIQNRQENEEILPKNLGHCPKMSRTMSDRDRDRDRDRDKIVDDVDKGGMGGDLLPLSADADSPSSVEQTKENKIPYQEIVALYHTILGTVLPSVNKLTATRKANIRRRWLNDLKSLAEWESFFTRVSESDYLMGRVKTRPFHCIFDWLIKESNCVKILEDTYSNYR